MGDALNSGAGVGSSYGHLWPSENYVVMLELLVSACATPTYPESHEKASPSPGFCLSYMSFVSLLSQPRRVARSHHIFSYFIVISVSSPCLRGSKDEQPRPHRPPPFFLLWEISRWRQTPWKRPQARAPQGRELPPPEAGERCGREALNKIPKSIGLRLC